jgi:hypothetical protein
MRRPWPEASHPGSRPTRHATLRRPSLRGTGTVQGTGVPATQLLPGDLYVIAGLAILCLVGFVFMAHERQTNQGGSRAWPADVRGPGRHVNASR